MRAIFYHSVLPKRDPQNYYTANVIEIDEFRNHASELAKNWRVLSLREIAETIRDGRQFPDRAVHLSFDDGFQNNLYAADILGQHRLPWTLFVITDAVLKGFKPWYVRLADAVAATNDRVRCLGVEYDLGLAPEKWRFAKAAKSIVMSVAAGEHLALLEEILSSSQIVRPETSYWPFLTLSELRQLHGAGVEIGNHTAHHPNLSQCSSAELDEEISTSQAELQEALNDKVRFFSYPDGRYNDAVMAKVRLSHELAMATSDSRQPKAPFELRRYPVGPSLSDLRAVLSTSYPLEFRAKSLKRIAKRHLKNVVGRRQAETDHDGTILF